MLTRQAKVLTEAQVGLALDHVGRGKHPLRDRAMVLLSVKAGLRAKEIAGVTWGMVCDAEGRIGDALALPNRASKGRGGGRSIPLHPDLRAALKELLEERRHLSVVHAARLWGMAEHPMEMPVVYSERGSGLTAEGVTSWFWALYHSLGFHGCSSHSGRRTFITNLARKISSVDGSLRDVQELAGHASLAMTQRYIAVSETAQRKAIELI